MNSGDDEAVVNTIEHWRRWRDKAEAELEHYAFAADQCECPICVSINHLPPAEPIPSRSERSIGEQWVSEMMKLN